MQKIAVKRARQDAIDPQTTGPAPKRCKPRKPLTEIGTNVQVFHLRDLVHTWNSKVEEDKEQAAARRHKDARAKKLKARQRAVRRGDTPPPLTPSQAEPFIPPGRLPPVPAPSLKQVILRPAPNTKHFTCSVCCAERSIADLINYGMNDDVMCLHCFHLLADGEFDPKWCAGCRRECHPNLFQSHHGIRQTCGDCQLTRRIRKAGQSSQPTSSPPDSQYSQRPPTPLPTDPLRVPAVSEGEWAFIQKFNQAIDAIALEECLHCNERWFNLDVQNGACRACRKKTGEVSTVLALITMRMLVSFLHIFRR